LSAEEERGIDDMRRLLEASWNAETMGCIPTNAESAAEAAAAAIDNAKNRALSASQNLFYVDLLLPQYDIRQGSNLYDEVLAVEFCVALSKRLKGRSAIVVRDDKTIQTVTRVLNARERDRQRATNLPDESNDDEEDDEPDEDPDIYDDFGRVFGDDSADVESFRDQLISGWRQEIRERRDSQSDAPSQSPPPFVAGYRLASMLGSAAISSGADMTDHVIKAVSANAQPLDEEDTVIILSAASREEMIGVRGLVSKFGGKKTIILVNCCLNPPPRELMKAQTVYSIQPFLARPKVSEGNIFGSNRPPSELNQQQSRQSQQKFPKIVLMRRFPRDWEIFVDIGSGFELARTVLASEVDKRGPSMEFIAGCVKQFMQARLG
jgi:hypothetical protein